MHSKGHKNSKYGIDESFGVHSVTVRSAAADIVWTTMPDNRVGMARYTYTEHSMTTLADWNIPSVDHCGRLGCMSTSTTITRIVASTSLVVKEFGVYMC